MPTGLSFLVITAVVAALLVLVALVTVVSQGRAAGAPRPPRAPRTARTKYELAQPMGATDPRDPEEGQPSRSGVLRILWWVTVAIVLIGVGVSDAFRQNQVPIYGLGAVAVVAVIAIHELLPSAWRGTLIGAIETLAALALAVGLLLFTDYARSPFFFVFDVIAVAAALSRGGRVAALVAVLASAAYGAVLVIDPGRGTYTGLELLGFAVNIGSIWLLAFLAGVFAAHERRVQSRVLQLSVTDPLTGLFNRAQIYTTLEQEIRRTRRSERGFCLLMVDLDGLKAINDTLGHHRGDEVLRALGLVIRRSIRAVDTAYRQGGDEFLVLLPETDYAGAYVVAEKIRAGAEETALQFAGAEMPTSVSIGLVSHPEDGLTVEELLIAADRAMYQAKSLGKNQISGDPRLRRLAARPLPGPTAVPGAPQTLTPIPAPTAGPSTASTPAPSVAATAAPEGSADREPELATPAAVRPSSGPATVGREPIPIGSSTLPSTEPAAPPAARAAATESEPSDVESETVLNGRADGTDETEPDAEEVGRRIEEANKRFESEHRIRRAMDAFLSPTQGPPTPPPGGLDRPT
ncbi:MAG: diguanylate cyclase [Chloroflexota bacterium]|nr:diguanylate cyclase [Chloroflexota bacterium]